MPPLPSFVFVLAATLAACCAATALEVLWKDVVYEPSLKTDFSGDVLESWGVHDAFWKCEIDFSGDVLESSGVCDAFWMCETDFGGDMLESWSDCDAFWMCETEFGDSLSVQEADLESHVLKFVDDGYENVNLGSGPVKVCLKDIFQKTLSHERKVATFEFQAHPFLTLLPLGVQLGRPRCIADTGFQGWSENSQSFW